MAQIVGRKLPPDKPNKPVSSDHRQISADKLDHQGNAGLAVTTYAGVMLARIDVVATVTYLGEAAPGSATSEPKWRIHRVTALGTATTIEWALSLINGRYGEFDAIWDNRLALTYG